MPPCNMFFSLMFIHFSIYFLITPCRNIDSPKPVEFYQLNPYSIFYLLFALFHVLLMV
jgi:hypothetical protein